MLLAKLIMLKRGKLFDAKYFLSLCFMISGICAMAQNSPYSRYGLGDLTTNTNVANRGMGGISAGYADFLSINFNNPASYSNFLAVQELRSKKIAQGRVVLDVGINIDNKTLIAKDNPVKFSTTDPYFSYVQVGIPIRKGWGLSFGLRQLSRINYTIDRVERLKDPRTGLPIDSVFTEFSGTGGSFLPSIGTGIAIGNFSIGANMGYLFGKKDINTRRFFLNDTVSYAASHHGTNTSFGDLFFNAGVQYKIDINRETVLRLGAAGNLQRSLHATQDAVRETAGRDATTGDYKIDSVFESSREGTVIYPASYTVGFTLEHTEKTTGKGWRFGVDYIQNKWSQFRLMDASDSVQDNWQIRIGGQFQPRPQENYFSRVVYRAGFSFGPDYIKVQNKLPQYNISFGIGLPVANYNRLAPGQFTIVNLGFEYQRRGNDNNLLKENTFKVSIGLNLSDIWFNKRKYD
ncbi:MAG: hypothetical protein C4330_02415 [Chitinophagaceae bacterium]